MIKEEIEKPGPGNYNSGREFGSGAVGFTMGGKKGVKYNENPGPGSYSRVDELIRSRS